MRMAGAYRAHAVVRGSAPGGLSATGMHATIASGRPLRVLAPVDTKRNVAVANKGPGFIVYNKTKWPLQISLDQVGPLYFEVVPPGGRFRRKTGAVWFTVSAKVLLDPKDKLTTWDAVVPIAVMTASVLAAAASLGTSSAVSGIGAAAAAGGSAVTATEVAVTSIASTLVGAGFTADSALVIGGAVVGGSEEAAESAVNAVIADVFSNDNMTASKAGQYAGKPWPFKSRMAEYEVRGGPYFKDYSGPPPKGLEDGKKPIVPVGRDLSMHRTK